MNIYNLVRPFKPLPIMKTCIKCYADLQELFNYCPMCGIALDKPIICKNCNYTNEPNSKFCQECGTSLFIKEKSIEPKEPEITIDQIPLPPITGITIEFPFTTAQSFPFAVNEAKKFETFEQFGKDKKAIYRINVNDDEIFKTMELLEHLKGWRKRTVYVNGEKALWDNVFSFQYCFQEKQASFKPEYYCYGYETTWDLNLWGCKKLGLSFSESAIWFTYGTWLGKSGDWKFDKERIKHELSKNVFYCKFCPAINIQLIEDILTALPEVVNPVYNKNWKFKQTYSSDSGNVIAETIKLEYGLERTVYYNGVAPNGMGFIKDIAENIRKKLPDFIQNA
jgi:hypothetical protein